MTSRIPYLIAIGAILVGAVFLYGWVIDNFVLEDYESKSGYSVEAKRNPFLAAHIFLEKLGADVTSTSGRSKLLELPPTDDVIIVNNFTINLSQKRQQSIMKWIEEGGHLIIPATRIWDEDRQSSGDRFLDEIGIKKQHKTFDTATDKTNQTPDLQNFSELNKLLDLNPNTETIPIQFSDFKENVNVAFNSQYIIETDSDKAVVKVGNESGTHLIQFEIGQGLLTIMSDNRFLKNDHIGNNDHALYLWLLSGKGQHKIWLLYSTIMPSLFSLAWQNAPHAIISAIILILLGVASLFNRFGPTIYLNNTSRRNILEHLQACAQYLWKLEGKQFFIEKSRSTILQTWINKHPTLSNLDEKSLCEWISTRYQFPEKDVYYAFYKPPLKDKDFIEITYHLQKLRKPL